MAQPCGCFKVTGYDCQKGLGVGCRQPTFFRLSECYLLRRENYRPTSGSKRSHGIQCVLGNRRGDSDPDIDFLPPEVVNEGYAVLSGIAGGVLGWLLGMYISPEGTTEQHSSLQRLVPP